MDFLNNLNNETDYDQMATRLVSKEGFADIKTLFPGYNIRVLLTAFMFKNFREVFDIPDALFEKTQCITEILLGIQHEKLNKEYPIYFEMFTTWRNDDITKLKESIEGHKSIYGTMLEEEIKDEADQQWHDGVSSSIALMEKHIDVLDEYSKTPPKN